jgi:Streptomyces sporulation and cell division protein, SsgA
VSGDDIHALLDDVEMFVVTEASWFGRPVCPGISLTYSPGDPYAVTIAFCAGYQTEPVEWMVSRESLNGAASAGWGSEHGDIRLWTEDDVLHIWLAACLPGDTEALLRTPVGPVRRFLGRTLDAVPFGTEMDHCDVEAELSRILED